MRITIATHRRHGKFTVSQMYQEKGIVVVCAGRHHWVYDIYAVEY